MWTPFTIFKQERMFYNHEISRIDIGKSKHFFSILENETGEIIVQPVSFSNDKERVHFFIQNLNYILKKLYSPVWKTWNITILLY